MHVERINEHQVRYIVTSQDLFMRKITMKDLCYGGKETADLFKELVTNATDQLGFNEEKLPVMIEAVPINPDELLVIISAVEEAEEADPHFAHFTEPDEKQKSLQDETRKFYSTEGSIPDIATAMFSFDGIDEVISFCKKAKAFGGRNSLYRSHEKHLFYLSMTKPEELPIKEFNTFLNSISECGTPVANGASLYAALSEHEQPVMDDPIHVFGGMKQ